MDAVLTQLRTSRRILEVWTEQFRMWLAAELLQPLAKLATTAQKVQANSPEQGHC